MGHSPGPPFFHCQAGLRAIQRLDLTFLIDREYQGFVRWIEIKTHDILDLLDEAFVVRQLKGLDQMRLQAVCVPNPLHARVADAERLGQRAGTPGRGLVPDISQRSVGRFLKKRQTSSRIASVTG